MSRATYCPCKGKYTMTCDKDSKKCSYKGSLRHGIGSLKNQSSSTVSNSDTTRVDSNDSTDYNL